MADIQGNINIYDLELLVKGTTMTGVTTPIDADSPFPLCWTPKNGLLIAGLTDMFYLDHRFQEPLTIEYKDTIQHLMMYNGVIYLSSPSHVRAMDFKTRQIIHEFKTMNPTAAVYMDSLYVAQREGGIVVLTHSKANPSVKVANAAPLVDDAAMEDNEPTTQADMHYSKLFQDDEEQGDDLDDFLEGDEAQLQGAPVNTDTVKEALKEIIHQHETFQSGTTPYVGNKRFLAYNLVGKVYKYKRDDGSFICGEFNENKRAFRYADLNEYEMADISHNGMYMARTETPYDVQYFDPNRVTPMDWQITMSKPIQCMAAFQGGVAICTDMIYIYDYCGMCIHVMAMEGAVITMACTDQQCLIAYNDALGHLNYMLVHILERRMITKGALPVSNCLFLGFSFHKRPMVMDDGLLLMLNEGLLWIPILDMREMEVYNEYSIWPIGISSDRFHFVACPVFLVDVGGDAVSQCA